MSECDTDKDETCFSGDAQRKDGLYPICKECRNSHQRELYALDPEKYNKKARENYWKNPEAQYVRQKRYETSNRERVLESRKQKRLSLKLQTLAAYGGVCECCGETSHEFLAIDHINGGGNRERKELRKSGVNFYQHLRDSNWPSGYRVLCHNCNQALGMYGYCPHQNLLVNLFSLVEAKDK